MADDNKSALQESYRRDLGQARRLPRLMPSASTPETDTNEDAEEDGQNTPEDDFSNDENDEADEEEDVVQEEEEEEDEEEAATEVEEAEGGGGPEGGKAAKEALEKAKKAATKKAQEAVARLASRLNIAKIGAALSVVGIIVTYLIMTLQFIIGNCLKKPWMPKLSIIEIILWFLVTSLLVLVLAIAFIMLIILLALSLGPVVALSLLGKELIGFIF